MQSLNPKPTLKFIFSGIVMAAALTTVIGLTAVNLSHFKIVGQTGIPFAYPWRLLEHSDMARITAWLGYSMHNLIIWGLIWFAKREKPKYTNGLHWFNWAMIGVSVFFAFLHIGQTQLWYDGLAQDVPEITALGSVAVMLMIIIILETPRRGLIFGKQFNFQERFMQIVREYHGYLFSWAIIYTFWYHPTENTWGHLLGFFYMFMLIAQSTLIFTRSHINKWWTFTLEFFVLIHGVVVAIFQGNDMWPMFAFGFGAMVILTQMYGLGLNTRVKRGLAIGFILLVITYYSLSGNLASINEVIRIPFLDYLVIFLLYWIYLGINGLLNLLKPTPTTKSAAD